MSKETSEKDSTPVAVVLAGGLGKRLRPVLPDQPKPMAPIRGRPFLDYLLDYWHDQGIRDFRLCVGYRHQAITSYFKDQYKSATITFHIEEQPLGTAGALMNCADNLPDQPTLLLNGDTWFPVPLADLISAHQASKASWTLALTPNKEPGRYGSVQLLPKKSTALTDWQLITGLGAGKADRLGQPVEGGVYLFNPASLPKFDQEGLDAQAGRLLTQGILQPLLSRKEVFCGLPSSAPFLDIGLPADYTRAESVIGAR